MRLGLLVSSEQPVLHADLVVATGKSLFTGKTSQRHVKAGHTLSMLPSTGSTQRWLTFWEEPAWSRRQLCERLEKPRVAAPRSPTKTAKQLAPRQESDDYFAYLASSVWDDL